MVGARLRELLLAGEGAGDCTGPGARVGTAEHPVCGDTVQLSVRVEAGTIRELRWRASGCPATVAVAALAAKVLGGAAVPAAAATLRRALAEHGGLEGSERHAETIVLRALAGATGSA